MDIFIFGLIGFKLKGKILPRLHQFTFPNKNEENDKTVQEKNLFYEKILERWRWRIYFALSVIIKENLKPPKYHIFLIKQFLFTIRNKCDNNNDKYLKKNNQLRYQKLLV